MIRILTKTILSIYKLLIDETGGSYCLVDESLLDSAADGTWQTFEGKDLYRSIEEKAAQLGFSLIKNHAFADGNKRIGMLAMMTFLEVNGIKIICSDEDIASTGFAVASDLMDSADLLDWITNHKKENFTV